MFRYCGSIDLIVKKFLYSETEMEEKGMTKDPRGMEINNEYSESNQQDHFYVG